MRNLVLKWSSFVALCFIWGSSFILMKISKTSLTAPQIASIRLFSAGIIFVPIALKQFYQLPKNKIGYVLLTGILGNLLPAFLFASALMKIDSSLAGILNALTPISVVAIGIIFFKDKIAASKLYGVAIGFIGLCLLTLLQNDLSIHNLQYALFIILATVSYGLNVNVVGHHLKDVKPIAGTAVSLAFLVIPTCLILWWQGVFHFDLSDSSMQRAVLSSVVLGVGGSAIATFLFYSLVQSAGGLFASMVTYGLPFVALFWGLLDGEVIRFSTLLCLLIILAGVFIANRSSGKANTHGE